MTTRIRKTITVLVAIAVVAGMAGAAAAITFDSETTNTGTTSDVSGATTTVTFNPDNTSKTLYVEVDSATTSNLSLELSPATKGVDHVAYQNDTPDTTNATSGNYAWSIGHGELSEVPREATGGTYNLTVYNTTSGNELLNTEVVLNSDNTNEKRAIIAVTNDSVKGEASALTPLVADRLELDSKSAGWFGAAMFWSDKNATDLAEWSGYTTVNGTNTTVTVQMENSTAASAYNAAAEGKDDGEAITKATVRINGIPHLVYVNEAPENYPDNTTLVTYDTVNEELTVELGSEYENVSNVNVRATAGTGYSFNELVENFGVKKAFQVAW